LRADACVEAQADTVKIFHNNGVAGNNDVDAFYSGAGHTSSQDTGAITAASLAGVDLLISWERTSAFTAAEILAMNGFLTGGGRIAFFGENDVFDTENNNINTALTGLGSSLQIDTATDVFFDTGGQTASGGQILPHFLNAGVSAFGYGAPNNLTGVGAGDGLFLSKSLSITFAAFDGSVGGDGIVVMTDSNVHSFSNASVDNDTWFLNLLTARATTPTPEPASLLLMGLGLAGLAYFKKR